MKIKKRHWFWGFFTLFLIWLLMQVPWQHHFGTPVVISQANTYLTEPVHSEGGIDYWAAWNQELSANISPEENALVALLSVIPLDFDDESYRQEFVKQLGLTSYPQEVKFIKEPTNFFPTILPPAADEDEKYARENQWWEEYESVQAQPWTTEQFPLWQQWLEEYRPAIDLVVEASHKPHYYHPFIAPNSAEDRSLRSIHLLKALDLSGTCVRFLGIRAMHSIAHGQSAAALEDILAIHRLASLHGQCPTSLTRLISMKLDGVAFAAGKALLENGDLNVEQLDQYADALASHVPRIDLQHQVDHFHRISILDEIQTEQLTGGNIDRLLKLGKHTVSLPQIACQYLINFMDWNALRFEFNLQFDSLVKLQDEPNDEKRYEQLTQHLDEQEAELLRWGNLPVLALTPSHRGRLFGKAISLQNSGMIVQMLESEQTAQTHLDLLKLGIAIEKYRLATSDYPERLSQLVPGYLETIPTDRFTHGDPLKYKRTDTGYVLYGVGMDRDDHGGEPGDGTSGWDIVLRVDSSKTSAE